ncbi:MAG: nucleoside recognition protein, partial [Alphaproteobacteria bacterium]|nr:nucleoside recognition protein [Alphaproteobacteria bacterium]
MSFVTAILHKTKETLQIYWMLARIMVPIMILAELLSRMGVIKAIAPGFAPVMKLIGLPPELGLAWLTGMLIGIWGAVPLIFTLVPASSLSVADITVFCSLILFAHSLPIEQKIIQKAGPNMVVTTILRIVGGLVYAVLLHHFLKATNWLSEPVDPTWIPMNATVDLFEYAYGLGETMITMLVFLIVLFWGLEILKVTGVLGFVMKGLSPVLRLAGLRGEVGHLTLVGLFLGISYGAGLLIREARSGTLP